jgi:hypothetical protein
MVLTFTAVSAFVVTPRQGVASLVRSRRRGGGGPYGKPIKLLTYSTDGFVSYSMAMVSFCASREPSA